MDFSGIAFNMKLRTSLLPRSTSTLEEDLAPAERRAWRNSLPVTVNIFLAKSNYGQYGIWTRYLVSEAGEINQVLREHKQAGRTVGDFA